MDWEDQNLKEIQICLEDGLTFPPWWSNEDKEGITIDTSKRKGNTSTFDGCLEFIGEDEHAKYNLKEISITDPLYENTSYEKFTLTLTVKMNLKKSLKKPEDIKLIYLIYPPLYI